MSRGQGRERTLILAEGDRGMATARKDAFGSDQQVSRIVRVRAGDCVKLMMNKSVKPLFTAPIMPL